MCISACRHGANDQVGGVTYKENVGNYDEAISVRFLVSSATLSYSKFASVLIKQKIGDHLSLYTALTRVLGRGWSIGALESHPFPALLRTALFGTLK